MECTESVQWVNVKWVERTDLLRIRDVPGYSEVGEVHRARVRAFAKATLMYGGRTFVDSYVDEFEHTPNGKLSLGSGSSE